MEIFFPLSKTSSELRESLVTDIPAVDGNVSNLFFQFTMFHVSEGKFSQLIFVDVRNKSLHSVIFPSASELKLEMRWDEMTLLYFTSLRCPAMESGISFSKYFKPCHRFKTPKMKKCLTTNAILMKPKQIVRKFNDMKYVGSCLASCTNRKCKSTMGYF